MAPFLHFQFKIPPPLPLQVNVAGLGQGMFSVQKLKKKIQH